MNNVMIKVQLGGPIEASAHSVRLIGGLLNSTPFMQEWAYKNGVIGGAGGIILNNAFTKPFLALGKVISTDINSKEAMTLIQQMAKEGSLPEKTWSKTWSKEFAEITNAKKVAWYDFSPVLYGKRSFDLKARVTMYKLTKAMNPEATPEQSRRMQYELGNYTHNLQGDLEKFVKKHGIAPFYSFASAIYRGGIKGVLGMSPLPIDAPLSNMNTRKGLSDFSKLATYKAAQLMTSGVIGYVGYWALMYKAQKDKWPWEDKTSKLGKLPFPGFAKNEWSKKVFFNEKNGTWDDISMSFFNPYMDRGTRAFGLPNAYQTMQLGGTKGQALEAAEVQALNTTISPYTSGASTQLAFKTFTGSAPYITSLRDPKGKPMPQFFPDVKAVSPGLQIPANFLQAATEVNPVISEGITLGSHYLGLGTLRNSYDSRDESSSSFLRMVFGIGFPRLTSPHGNDAARAFFIKKQQKEMAKSERRKNK
jgi:hypothetical protein